MLIFSNIKFRIIIYSWLAGYIILSCPMLWRTSSISESHAFDLALEWKILRLFHFLHSFFFFVLGHMFSVNQLQFWIEKIQYLNFTEICTIIRRIWLHHLNLFLYFIMCYKKIWIGKTTFLRFCSSFTLEHNFSLVHLKYSPKYLTVKSSNSLSVKIFK